MEIDETFKQGNSINSAIIFYIQVFRIDLFLSITLGWLVIPVGFMMISKLFENEEG